MNEQETLKTRLQALVEEMVGRGILFEDARAEFERHFILLIVERHHGNLSKAAEELRIHRNTLGKKIRELEAELAKARRAAPPKLD